MLIIKYRTTQDYHWYYIEYLGSMRTVKRKKRTNDFINVVGAKDPNYFLSLGITPLQEGDLLEIDPFQKLLIRLFR